MEAQTKAEPKLPDMIMCGDHPSYTKTELNVKDSKQDEKEKKVTSYSRLSPSTSRTERTVAMLATAAGGGGEARRSSEYGLRLADARRRARDIERHDNDISMSGNHALIQAALGSFRWPPYLLGVWVVVLILTHLLHCVVNMLERTLPNIRRFSQYLRTWTEEAWKDEYEVNHRVYPLALAAMTGLLYSVYFTLYIVYSIALWSIEPLCSDLDERQSSVDIIEAKVTNYVDDINSKTNIKH